MERGSPDSFLSLSLLLCNFSTVQIMLDHPILSDPSHRCKCIRDSETNELFHTSKGFWVPSLNCKWSPRAKIRGNMVLIRMSLFYAFSHSAYSAMTSKDTQWGCAPCEFRNMQGPLVIYEWLWFYKDGHMRFYFFFIKCGPMKERLIRLLQLRSWEDNTFGYECFGEWQRSHLFYVRICKTNGLWLPFWKDADAELCFAHPLSLSW